MKQKISDFHLDSENHWVADLVCGHKQHVRHDPPWMEREWVTTPEGRKSRLGTELNCVRCDECGTAVAQAVRAACLAAAVSAYEDGGLSGICLEGRWELAVDALKSVDLKNVIEQALHEDSIAP